MAGRVSASRILDAKVDDVFAVVTDIARLREWNTAITALIERSDSLHPLTFWQRTLLVGIRSRQVEHTELVHSLATLEKPANRRSTRHNDWRQTVTQNISVDPETLHDEAVRQLCKRGFTARRLEDGIPEWKRAGLPIAAGTGG